MEGSLSEEYLRRELDVDSDAFWAHHGFASRPQNWNCKAAVCASTVFVPPALTPAFRRQSFARNDIGRVKREVCGI